jgi:hypothetical protein
VVQRDRVRLELRRTVLHAHEMPVLRSSQNIAAADLTLTADDLARIAEITPDGGLGGRLS